VQGEPMRSAVGPFPSRNLYMGLYHWSVTCGWQFLKGLENGPKAHQMNGCHDGALAFVDRAGIAPVALECLCLCCCTSSGRGMRLGLVTGINRINVPDSIPGTRKATETSVAWVNCSRLFASTGP
jgi:hypothetical protein